VLLAEARPGVCNGQKTSQEVCRGEPVVEDLRMAPSKSGLLKICPVVLATVILCVCAPAMVQTQKF